MEFDLPKEQSSIIKVIGVGGGGSNAVNYMFTQGIRGVNFVVCNTDAQALENSPIPNKIQLGPFLTEGLGAGADPEIGKHSAEESIEEIKRILEKNTKMVFVTAGMGGGTGTGAAPVIAKAAKEMGILTVGIVTKPFKFEGTKRVKNALEGIEELRKQVDSLIIISNDKVLEIFKNCKKTEAFAKANDILAIGARSTSEIITQPGDINVDFADVKSVMKNSGVALMGCAVANGEQRALTAVTNALNSPLLDNNKITGAKKVLINIIGGVGDYELTMEEIGDINEYVQSEAGELADLFLGTSNDENLKDNISVTVIATGFEVIENNDASTRQQQLTVQTIATETTAKSVDTQENQNQEKQFVVLEETQPIENNSLTENISPEKTDIENQSQEFISTENILSPKNNSDEVEQDNYEFQFNFSQTNNEQNTQLPFNEIELYNNQLEISDKTEQEETPVVSENSDEEEVFKVFEKNEEEENITPQISAANKNAYERTAYLDQLNKKLNNPNIFNELEKVSAFKRKNIQLGAEEPSNHSNSLSSLKHQVNEDGTSEIRTLNNYFHNKPD